MEKRDVQFWAEYSIDELSEKNWEALCDGCGQCCMIKFEDEDTGEILFTNVACRLFDDASCRCTDYPHRTQKIPGCLEVRNFNNTQYKWLPETCAYRLLHEGKVLFDWHPLISGCAESVFQAGISVRGKNVAENDVSEEEMVNHIIDLEEET
jgi:uncharacterized cysteine cluster protein YcgN (CxxCxxCC family)